MTSEDSREWPAYIKFSIETIRTLVVPYTGSYTLLDWIARLEAPRARGRLDWRYPHALFTPTPGEKSSACCFTHQRTTRQLLAMMSFIIVACIATMMDLICESDGNLLSWVSHHDPHAYATELPSKTLLLVLANPSRLLFDERANHLPPLSLPTNFKRRTLKNRWDDDSVRRCGDLQSHSMKLQIDSVIDRNCRLRTD